MPSASLTSFAKINVGLKIISKRDDGYHDLETIFYPVDLYDYIDITIEPGYLQVNSININSDFETLPNDSSNICYEAIEHFFNEFPQKDTYAFDIFIHKNIPVGGGLAGGSSNAGAVINYLAEHFGIDKEKNWDRLIKVAIETGSDVPFFLYGKPCFASGRGEKIIPLESFEINYDILLVNPNIHVSTKEAFDALAYEPGEIHKSDLKSVEIFELGNEPVLENDFERVVFPMYPEIAEIKKLMLENGAVFSSLSGSGATVYGLFAPQEFKLEMLMQNFNESGYFTYLSELKNRQSDFQTEL